MKEMKRKGEGEKAERKRRKKGYYTASTQKKRLFVTSFISSWISGKKKKGDRKESNEEIK